MTFLEAGGTSDLGGLQTSTASPRWHLRGRDYIKSFKDIFQITGREWPGALEGKPGRKDHLNRSTHNQI